MNNYIKSKINLNRININLFLALMPLLIYGFYKNGIKLYLNNIVGIEGMLKPLIFDIAGLIIGILVNIIYFKLIKKEKDKLLSTMFKTFYPYYGLLVASLISINTNILLFIGLTFTIFMISKIINKKIVNIPAITVLAIIFITDVLGKFSYLNLYEQSNKLNLNTIDYLLGRGSGGINTTCIILLILSLCLLFNKIYYKKEIAIYSTVIYIIGITTYTITSNNLGLIFDNIFSNGIIFSYIFVATDTVTSPSTLKGQIVYSVMIGMLSIVLYTIYPALSAIGAIAIASICSKTIDKICEK